MSTMEENSVSLGLPGSDSVVHASGGGVNKDPEAAPGILRSRDVRSAVVSSSYRFE
ncbi:hypothetical protein DIZ76_017804 [Coccidioides immitis]|nr:hypothetical protein DIZ76_017804 [Coccidioides immitis]